MHNLPEYHQSGIGMFLKCQKQYWFRYIEKIIVPPKAALTVGRSVDAGTTYNFTHKVVTGVDLPEQDVLDVCAETFDKEAPDTEWGDDDKGKQKDLSISLTKLHHTVVAPKIMPETVQEQFRIEVDAGYAIAGTMDLTTKDKWIRDTKTAKAKYADDAVSTSLQAATYDFAYEATRGCKPAGFAFDVLKKTKVPDYQEVVGQVSLVQREDLFEAITLMHRQIQRGEFLPSTPDAWWCSKEWCGYWSVCRGRK